MTTQALEGLVAERISARVDYWHTAVEKLGRAAKAKGIIPSVIEFTFCEDTDEWEIILWGQV